MTVAAVVFVVFLYQIVSVSLLDGADYRADGLA
ncbi:MAG: hypothetical protein RLZ86_845, partial [Actinomycetota bacterium]